MPTRQPRGHTATPTQRRLLTDAEKQEHRRASVRKMNAKKRDVYLSTKHHCERCGCTLLLCDCPAIGAHVAQYRDVVIVVNVRTMRRRVEIR